MEPIIIFAIFSSFSKFYNQGNFAGVANGFINLLGILAFMRSVFTLDA
jgi:hypothetical protein